MKDEITKIREKTIKEISECKQRAVLNELKIKKKD